MTKPKQRLLTIDDYEKAARKRLSSMAYDYFRSGSDDERTLKRNRKAFRRFEIWPRMLVDIAERDLETEVLGTRIEFPVLVAPTAYHRLAHPDGESETARGAAAAGTIFVLSTLSTTSIEDVAAASTGPMWFQLYIHKDRGLTKSLVERAQAAGFLAIVLTVDAPVLGRRLADERNEFALPQGMSMVNLEADLITPGGGSSLSEYLATRHDPSVTWDDIEWLRSITSLPLLIKGVLRADDAARAVQAGSAGVIVSNHGGRQLDGAPASIDALHDVVDAVNGRAEIFLDGGVRWGTDVLKAVAMGAKAVLVGRPVLWGLALDGAEGVTAVLHLFRDELSTAMALAGCAGIASVTPDLIRPRAR